MLYLFIFLRIKRFFFSDLYECFIKKINKYKVMVDVVFKSYINDCNG